MAIGNITEIFERNGLFSCQLPFFEFRLEQQEMVQAVWQAFITKNHLLVEAGTGTGKSFAYLVPAIYWSVSQNKKVVISTKTINLQEQIFYKDLPALKRILPIKFHSVLVKGRTNYLCLKKFHSLYADYRHLEDKEKEQLLNIHLFLSYFKEGTLNEVSFQVKNSLWSRICSESESCLFRRCVHYESCFFHKARRQIEGANLLVVNHSLFFTDLASRINKTAEISVLPEFTCVVFDEAHHLENIATDYLGLEVSFSGLEKVLTTLYHKEGQRDLGLLAGILDILGVLRKSIKKGMLKNLLQMTVDLVPQVNKTREISEEFFTKLLIVIDVNRKNKADDKLRLLPCERDLTHGWLELLKIKDRLVNALAKLADLLKQLVQLFSLLDKTDHELTDYFTLLLPYAESCWQFSENLEILMQRNDPQLVYWLEGREHVLQSALIKAVPIDISLKLKENLFDKVESVALTSATLTVNKDFSFTKERLGLKEARSLMLNSSFDYQKQALLCVPTDFPYPDDNGFRQELVMFLLKLFEFLRGRTLVLFTSYTMLQQTASLISTSLEKLGIELLVQGTLERSVLLNRFKKSPAAVLFGTDSFWEGIDVPGKGLQCVVLARLPFRVPTDPVVAARNEYLQNLGRDAFREYIIPLAVMKFKQGFGRLIRSKQDKGVVVILDKRVIEKDYGRYFINSLPDVSLIKDKQNMVLKQVKNFLKEF